MNLQAMQNNLSKQSRYLRSVMFKRFIASFSICAIAALTFYVVFDTYISPAVGNFIADNTSTWQYGTYEDLEDLPLTNTREVEQLTPGEDNEGKEIPNDKIRVRYRNLDTYMQIRKLKNGALPVLLVLGIAMLMAIFMNRFVQYFDEITHNVTVLFENTHAPISLSDDLSIIESELQNIQSKTLKSEEAARQAEQRKDELVTYLAHDIRTPMTSVKGYISLLRDRGPMLDRERYGYADIAFEKSVRVETMLDELFETARFNLQELRPQLEHVDLVEFCRNVATELYPYASERNLRIVLTNQRSLPCAMDPALMARAVLNIVRNAITYANEGSAITLDACFEGGMNTIAISDEGLGISDEDLERVFQRFFRVDEARSENTGGFGLGLAISREIVKAHGGTVCAHCVDGITTFTVRFPNGDEEAQEPRLKPAPMPSIKKRSVGR